MWTGPKAIRWITSAALLSCAPAALAIASETLPSFREQLIDDDGGDIWAMIVADVNTDGRPDILVVSWSDPAHVVWYQNPSWKRRYLVKDFPRMLVCIQPLDINQDGHLEFLLGADYIEPLDTTQGGTVWIVHRSDEVNGIWNLKQIDAQPTMHRFRPIDLAGTGKKQGIVCSTLLGQEGGGASLYVLSPPDRPFDDRWEREMISDDLHLLHNTWSIDWDGNGKEEVLASANEGIVLFKRKEPGKWTRQTISNGYQGGRKTGSSEIAVGRLPGGQRYLAAVEPHHGHEAVIYTQPEEANQLWKRDLIIENRGGHTIWPADLTGTGVDSLLVGFVGHYGNAPVPDAPIIYLCHPLDSQGRKWKKVVLDDDPNISGEDGTCADLNGDGHIDVVLAGLKKVKVFWNEGK